MKERLNSYNYETWEIRSNNLVRSFIYALSQAAEVSWPLTCDSNPELL